MIFQVHFVIDTLYNDLPDRVKHNLEELGLQVIINLSLKNMKMKKAMVNTEEP